MSDHVYPMCPLVEFDKFVVFQWKMMYIVRLCEIQNDCCNGDLSHFFPFFFFFLFALPPPLVLATTFPVVAPLDLLAGSAVSVSISMAFCVLFDEEIATSEGRGKPAMSAVISRVNDSNLLMMIADLALNLRHCRKQKMSAFCACKPFKATSSSYHSIVCHFENQPLLRWRCFDQISCLKRERERERIQTFHFICQPIFKTDHHTFIQLTRSGDCLYNSTHFE